ncbi:MAG: PAC2 family protein [Methanothrix sp.]|nr:PAC2 family protein [Methanothrix sp.]
MFESCKICIAGLPGIGSVGKVACEYLATALESSTYKSFFSRVFPAQVMVSNGMSELLHAELKVPKDRNNMLLLSGDAQPLDVVGMYRLAGDVLETLKEERVTDVITLAAYVGDTKEKVLGAASDFDGAAALAQNKIPLLRTGAIGGLNGLLAGLAPLHEMRGFCLLGTSSGADLVDIRAATSLLEALKELLHLDLEISLMEPETEGPEEFVPEDVDMNYR